MVAPVLSNLAVPLSRICNFELIIIVRFVMRQCGSQYKPAAEARGGDPSARAPGR